MAKNRPIQIRVFADDNNGQKHGTFTGPPPKLRVNQGDTITWDLQVVPNDPTAEFSIQFLNGITPLVDGRGNLVFQFGPVSGSATYQVKNPDPNPTEYQYQIHVTTENGTFSIDHCPVVDDSGN